MTHDAESPILRVEDLTTSLLLDGQWRSVVRHVGFEVRPRETVALVGESGSGKTVTALSIMRLLPQGASRIEGRIVLDGRDVLPLSNAEMRQVRGNDCAMIFQEPMTSLNPVFTIGRQISEALIVHRGLGKDRARAETHPAARARPHPERRIALHRLSASVLRRHAPARDDRHGSGLPSEAADRRRADHRTRRDDPGPDPRSDQGSAAGRRHVRALHHPRYGCRRGNRRPDNCHVSTARRWKPVPRNRSLCVAGTLIRGRCSPPCRGSARWLNVLGLCAFRSLTWRRERAANPAR